jgi:hypothetical protein
MVIDKKHLIGWGLAVLLALGLVYSIEARIADKADARATAAEAQLSLIQKQNADFQSSVQKQLDSLASQNQQLTNALAKQKQIDASLSPSQLGERVASLTDVPKTEVTPLENGHFDLTSNAVLQAALKLEEVPVLTEQFSNETKSLDLEKQAHQSDLVASNAALTSCKADLTKVTADARKSKWKWFGAGVVVGFLGKAFVQFP